MTSLKCASIAACNASGLPSARSTSTPSWRLSADSGSLSIASGRPLNSLSRVPVMRTSSSASVTANVEAAM